MNLGTDGEPSLEKLALLKPDLILAGAGNVDNYALLTQIAPTLQWKSRGAKGQWQESLRAIAKALGREAMANNVLQQHEKHIVAARDDFADVVAAYPKLLLLGAHRLNEGVFAFDSDNYLGEILEGVGFQLMPQHSSEIKPGAPISVEALPKLNDADIIIILGYDLDVSDREQENSIQSADQTGSDWIEAHQIQTIKQDWERSEIAQSLTASKEGRVYFATYYKWNGLNGPTGAKLILEQLRQFLLKDA